MVPPLFRPPVTRAKPARGGDASSPVPNAAPEGAAPEDTAKVGTQEEMRRDMTNRRSPDRDAADGQSGGFTDRCWPAPDGQFPAQPPDSGHVRIAILKRLHLDSADHQA